MKAKLVLFTILFTIVLGACQKEKPVQKELKITDFTITPAGTVAQVSVTVTYPGELTATLKVSQSEDMSEATTFVLEKESTEKESFTFNFIVCDLMKVTNYWCQIEVGNVFLNKKTDVVNFTTFDKDPVITTAEVTDIVSCSASSGGAITADGGFYIVSRGVCWSTHQSPTINDSKSIDGQGTGDYNSRISNLIPNTTYYVRAYAVNGDLVFYGDEHWFSTPVLPEGAFPFPFSVSANKQVLFSKSNLYRHRLENYYFSDDQTIRNGSTTTGGWSGYGSDQYDLFQWYENIDFPIEGGGNGSVNWRMLSVQEWLHLIEGRTNAKQLCGPATIGDVQGWIILPDNWEQPSNISFDCNANTWTQNTYNITQWMIFQNLGAVFLPSAGTIKGYYYGNQTAWYWTSDYSNSLCDPCYITFDATSYITGTFDFDACSIRLVTDF